MQPSEVWVLAMIGSEATDRKDLNLISSKLSYRNLISFYLVIVKNCEFFAEIDDWILSGWDKICNFRKLERKIANCNFQEKNLLKNTRVHHEHDEFDE